MYQSINFKATKRVPSQPHLTLFTQPIYKGFPVLTHHDGLIEECLERIYLTIDNAAQKYSRFFAVRLDLHFPAYFFSCEQEVLSNDYLRFFIKTLRRILNQYKEEKLRLIPRVHDVDFGYVWARENGPVSGKPHFHILILFSGHTFNTLGRFSNDRESLYNRFGEAWAETLGLHAHEGVNYIHFPTGGDYMVQSSNFQQRAELFLGASYLAKVSTKNFDEGCHVFGTSRLK